MVDKFYHNYIVKEAKPNLIYILSVFLSEKGVHHKRIVYNFLDVMGDIGGVFEITMIVFGVVFIPIAEHSFIMTAARQMFFARTKCSHLFNTDSKNEEPSPLEKYAYDPQKLGDNDTYKIDKEIQKHQIIRITKIDHVLLYLTNNLTSKCMCHCWKKREKL